MNNLVIVTTTINNPTKATLKFSEMGIPMIIVGDLKTPHKLYSSLPNVTYLTPEYQQKNYSELSSILGWNNIQRRNIGFIEAYRQKYEIIATVDDDNIPYDNWGKNLFVNKQVEADIYSSNQLVFDPLHITNYSYLWHRGFPIESVPFRKTEYLGKKIITPLIQADLWDGDPDIDSICRLTYKPICKFQNIKPFSSNQISPFNSQNTFIHRSLLPYYMVIPHIGRMDDIWGAYILQYLTGCQIVFNEPTVYQERNIQSLIINLSNEIEGYKNTLKLVNDIKNYKNFLPDKSNKSFEIYTSLMKSYETIL